VCKDQIWTCFFVSNISSNSLVFAPSPPCFRGLALFSHAAYDMALRRRLLLQCDTYSFFLMGWPTMAMLFISQFARIHQCTLHLLWSSKRIVIGRSTIRGYFDFVFLGLGLYLNCILGLCLNLKCIVSSTYMGFFFPSDFICIWDVRNVDWRVGFIMNEWLMLKINVDSVGIFG